MTVPPQPSLPQAAAGRGRSHVRAEGSWGQVPWAAAVACAASCPCLSHPPSSEAPTPQTGEGDQQDPADARRCQSGAPAPPEAASQSPLLRDSPPRHCSGGCHRGDLSKLQTARPLPRRSCLGPQPRSARHLPRLHQASRGQVGRGSRGPRLPRRLLCTNSRQRCLAVLQLLSQASGRPRTRPPSLDHWDRSCLCSQSTPPPPRTPLGPWGAWLCLGRVPPAAMTPDRGQVPWELAARVPCTCEEGTLPLGHALACPAAATPAGPPASLGTHVSSGDGSGHHASRERGRWTGKPIRATRPGGSRLEGQRPQGEELGHHRGPSTHGTRLVLWPRWH